MARMHPGGVLNCGMSHGIPGPLACLSLAKRHGVDSAGMAESIGRMADWLIRHRVDDEWGINWPTVVPSVRAKSDAPGGPAGGGRPSRTAWCYGSPGVARSLWLAGKALDRPGYGALAVEAMLAVLNKPVRNRGIPSPTYCHGVAGLLSVVLRFAVETGHPLFRRGANELIAQLVDAYEPGSVLGYRSIEADGRRVDNPGLLDGAPGVVLALMAATSEAEPAWDRVFLLS